MELNTRGHMLCSPVKTSTSQTAVLRNARTLFTFASLVIFFTRRSREYRHDNARGQQTKISIKMGQNFVRLIIFDDKVFYFAQTSWDFDKNQGRLSEF